MSKRNKIKHIEPEKHRERLKRDQKKWLAQFLVPWIPSFVINADLPFFKKEGQGQKGNPGEGIGHYGSIYPLPPNDQSLEISFIQVLGNAIQGFYYLLEVIIIAGVLLAIFYLLFQYLKSR